MEFVSIDLFLDDVLPEVPGCSKYTAIDNIRLAAIDFCKQTGISVETSEEQDIDANEPIFDLPSPGSNVRPWQVLWMNSTQGPITPVSRRVAVEWGATWETLTGDWPCNYLHVNNSQVRFVPIPTESRSESLTVHCSYIPTRNADRLDAVLLDEYREAITSGALYRLLRMSKEPWYDPTEARERRDMFAIAVNFARPLADKDFMTGEQSVMMRPMA